MRILVTGGCGHIGSKFIRSYKKHDLTVVDNLSTQRYCSLFSLDRNIKFFNLDFGDLTLDYLKQFDVVIHLAAITDAPSTFKDPSLLEKTNVEKTKRFFDTCRLAGCRVIFPSSTSVYGKAVDEVFEDDESALNPQSPYAEAKINIENYLRANDGRFTILRFGTIFGYSEGMKFHTAINKFCFQAALGEPLTVWKQNYEQYRPYLGLNDCVDALSLCIDNEDLVGSQETYNVLSTNTRLKDIVSFITKVKSVKVNYVDTPLLNQHSYFVNDDKIKSLGFCPEDDLFHSISKTLKALSGIDNA